MVTLVKFYSHLDGEVLAVFPQLKYNKQLYGNDMLTGYAHVGQHHAVHKDYLPYIFDKNRPYLDSPVKEATKIEYSDLAAELISIGYDLKILNKDKGPKMYWATFNYGIEFQLPEDVVLGCYHSGPCDYDVENSRLLPEVIAALNALDPEKLKKELREYGAWDETELSNHDENLNRILWLAASDIQEQNEEWLNDHPLAN